MSESVGPEAIELLATIKSAVTQLEALISGLNPVQAYIKANLFLVPGNEMPFSLFYSAFKQSLPAEQRAAWTKLRVTQALAPLQVSTVGRDDQPQKIIRGLGTVPPPPPSPPKPPKVPRPDYDPRAMLDLFRSYEKAGLEDSQIAAKMNEDGILDEYNERWNWRSVLQVRAD